MQSSSIGEIGAVVSGLRCWSAGVADAYLQVYKHSIFGLLKPALKNRGCPYWSSSENTRCLALYALWDAGTSRSGK